jgi:3-oxoacyl-(acyl-carrier-protein) synthase
MRRRVAITGLGCVTPLGSGSGPYLDGLRTGASGVRRITLSIGRAAGEDRRRGAGFDPADHIPAKDARHVARVVPMAIAAAGEASPAGIDPGAFRSTSAAGSPSSSARGADRSSSSRRCTATGTGAS